MILGNRDRPAAKPQAKWQPMAYPSKAASAELFADISSNNASFDARSYASAGHLQIAIKATQGTDYTDPKWEPWVTAAHANNLAIVHYHFCALANPAAEADYFWGTVRPHFNAKTDRLALDIETGPQGSWPSYLAELDAELYRLSGLEAVGYTFASALTPKLHLRSGKWWVASYGTAQPSGPLRGLPNGSLWGWQYAQGGPIVDPSNGPHAAAGIGDVDMSVLSPPIVSLIRNALGR